jgi:hypothetical protein
MALPKQQAPLSMLLPMLGVSMRLRDPTIQPSETRRRIIDACILLGM